MMEANQQKRIERENSRRVLDPALEAVAPGVAPQSPLSFSSVSAKWVRDLLPFQSLSSPAFNQPRSLTSLVLAPPPVG